jgi:hypothetical protein
VRRALLRLLGKGANLQSSYLPGRSGFVITTPRSLSVLRQALMPRWACRLYPICAERGRLFLEPTSALLRQALFQDPIETWWTSDHQAASEFFFTAARADRVRRLRNLVAAKAGPGARPCKAFRRLRPLALRLEALHVTPRPDKHWRALAEAFDELWRSTPLHTLGSDPLAGAVFAFLQRCRTCSAPQRGIDLCVSSPRCGQTAQGLSGYPDG